MSDVKYSNPIYYWIAESILTEQAIAIEKKDAYSLALTLILDSIYTPTELKKKIKVLTDIIEADGFRERNIVAMAILVFISESQKLDIAARVLEPIREIIAKSHRINLPLNYKTQVYFFASQTKLINTSALKEYLEKEKAKAIEDNSKQRLIEIDFALGKDEFSKDYWNKQDGVFNSLDKKAKMGYLYSFFDEDTANSLVNQVESGSWEHLSSASLPEISLLIYEAERIINTNLPADKLQQLLDTLKKQKKEWATLITKLESEGVTVDLSLLNRISGLSVEESVWSLFFLEKMNRKDVYQLGETEFGDYKEYKKISRNGIFYTSKVAIITFLSFVTFASIIIYSYFIFFGLEQISATFSSSTNLSKIPILPQTVGDFYSYLSFYIGFIYIHALYLYWKSFSQTHKFSVQYGLILTLKSLWILGW